MEAFTIYQNISNTTYFFVEDAYDLKYEIDIWKFKIRGLPERELNKGEIFIIDINYLLYKGEFDTIAKCWTKGGEANIPIILSCNVEYENQTENGSIKIEYLQTSKSTLKWIGVIDIIFKITFKATLKLVKAYDLNYDIEWKFKIKTEGTI